MTVVVWIASAMLAVAAFLAIARIVRGPSALDRAVALDVLLSCLIGAIGLEAAYNRHGTTLAVLAVLALLGFVGSVAVARFAAGEEDSQSGSGAGPGGGVGIGGVEASAIAGGTSPDPSDVPIDPVDAATGTVRGPVVAPRPPEITTDERAADRAATDDDEGIR